MLYQLPNGKVINISIDQFLDMTDQDIQYFMSVNGGDYCSNPFTESACIDNAKEKYYDFEFLPTDDLDDIPDNNIPFDYIIDLTEGLDI
jgi:hypothetical protein